MGSITNKQLDIRKKVNNTVKNIKAKLLHEDFFENIDKNKDRIALIWYKFEQKKYMTYSELYEKVLKCATLLKQNNVKAKDNVAISMKKGPNQIIAALGILTLGATYVPIGIYQPDNRRKLIHEKAKIKVVLTDKESNVIDNTDNTHIKILNIEEANNLSIDVKYDKNLSTEDNAYIIFTSGTTGEPKGVVIQHSAAMNTIQDINDKFKINKDDKIIAVSELDFDLSVYDIFGLLNVGGTVILLEEETKKEPKKWIKIIEEEKVTVWNTVPALFEMLLLAYGKNDKMEESIKVALISGDWIKPKLFTKLREKSSICKLVALGGATEASIWSNYYIVESIKNEWRSMPYGYPLSNQKYRIVNDNGELCADYVPGRIQIGGKGLAKEYCNNLELTKEKFIYDNGEKWYDTGDIGQYWEDGCIEFLGRNDEQIKLNGFRIELGEIDNAILTYSSIDNVITTSVHMGDNISLASAIVPKDNEIIFKKIDKLPIKEIHTKLLDLQTYIVKRCLVKILNLKEDNKITIPEIMKINSFDERKLPLIELWIEWLSSQKTIVYEDGIIKQDEILRIEEDKDNELLISFENEIDFIRDILKGERSEFEILDNITLSPEKLFFKDKVINKIVSTIKEEVNKTGTKNGYPVNVAMLKSNTGMFVEKLLKEIDSEKIHITLLDTPNMNRLSKERLEKKYNNYTCKTIPGNYIDENLIHSFDIVVSINSLHTYEKVKKGLQSIKYLLKEEGISITLEITSFPPFSLLTAAILENGLKHYNLNNRPVINNPMLSSEIWLNIFEKLGLEYVTSNEIEGSLSEIFVHRFNQDENTIKPNDVKQYLEEHIPAYMIPEEIKLFLELPLSGNGKINKSEIKDIFLQSRLEQANESEADLENDIQEKIATIWSEVLGINVVSRNSNFFTLGGDSLLATHFMSLIKEEYSIELSLKDIFEKPILSELSFLIDSKIEENRLMNENVEVGEI